MLNFTSTVRVAYSDTDQMGYVHHNNYVKYFENARWEMFEQMGIPYSEIERKGYMLPVIRMDLKFIKPVLYDELLTIKTILQKISEARLIFRFKAFNEKHILVNKAEISLAFIDAKTRIPCIAPEFICEKIAIHRIL